MNLEGEVAIRQAEIGEIEKGTLSFSVRLHTEVGEQMIQYGVRFYETEDPVTTQYFIQEIFLLREETTKYEQSRWSAAFQRYLKQRAAVEREMWDRQIDRLEELAQMKTIKQVDKN